MSNNYKFFFYLKKTVALSLIASSLYKTYLALNDILFIYPKLSFLENPDQIYLELIKKAIYLSMSLTIDSVYGFSLLIKPLEKTKQYHVYFGIILFIFSILFFRLHTLDTLIKNWLLLPIS